MTEAWTKMIAGAKTSIYIPLSEGYLWRLGQTLPGLMQAEPSLPCTPLCGLPPHDCCMPTPLVDLDLHGFLFTTSPVLI